MSKIAIPAVYSSLSTMYGPKNILHKKIKRLDPQKSWCAHAVRVQDPRTEQSHVAPAQQSEAAHCCHWCEDEEKWLPCGAAGAQLCLGGELPGAGGNKGLQLPLGQQLLSHRWVQQVLQPVLEMHSGCICEPTSTIPHVSDPTSI